MNTSEINFKISLDENNIPEKIHWDATQKPSQGLEETKAIALSLWDNAQNNTLRIDLWTKEMTTMDMKRFVVDSIGGLAQTIENSTGDRVMSEYMNELCNKLVEHLKSEQGQR